MNQTKITAFGGAVHDDSELQDGNETMSIEEFLNTVLGPRQLEGPLLIPVTVFYVLVFLTGLVGNLSVCLVIARNRSLHNAMNYYLISLAVADLTILILGLPNELSIYWHQYPFPFGELFCKLRSFISETSSYASVLTIMAFSLERYIAICRPLQALPWSDCTRVSGVSSLCWFLAMLFSLPHLLFTKLNYVDYPWQSGHMLPESAFCALLDDNIYPQWYPVHEISFLLFFLVPVILLSFLYTSMACVVRKSARAELRRSVHRHSTGAPTDHRQQIIRMLFSVVVIFFFSWAPFHVQVGLKKNILCQKVLRACGVEQACNSTQNARGCLYFLSSTLNPLLYNLMSAKYREAFKNTFCGGNKEVDRTKIPAWVTQTSTTTLLNTGSRRASHDILGGSRQGERSGSMDLELSRISRDRFSRKMSYDARFETVIEEKEDAC
ncbi:neuropeptides capa receptor [Eurytemora carolleeae]|uniref:neuropeptides capa receptor n=1 Tax=Eurytemora carolleeae TaxID=1294199 RepID=UPI000C77655D|nr:neuropeptides capa receptor [Eurytemora carolleeae]|eukprot:XP_023325610.1 neuropeptides capa receptor-like [Eurytemora affinis]